MSGFARAEVEAILADAGFSILQDGKDGLVFYSNNFNPPCDLILDWSRGKCEWDDIQGQLIDQGIDPTPFQCLLENDK